jgi:threonylcarbamoyladenosine tRNA methylthiotransferase MtaB
LKRMFRKYRTRHYASRVDLARKLMPDAAIGADVMTGFPGETDAEFAESVRFIEQQPFTYLHVFTYSERPGTVAALNPGAVPISVRRERTRILREMSDGKNRAFRRGMLGRSLSAVTLNRQSALTTNFIPVELSRARDANEIVDIQIGSLTESALRERELLPVLPS